MMKEGRAGVCQAVESAHWKELSQNKALLDLQVLARL